MSDQWQPLGQQPDPSFDPVEPPEAPESGDAECELPHGLFDSNGVLHRTATIREMTGADEEAIAKAAQGKNYAAFVDKILLQCVETIAGQEVSREMVQALVLADRDYLLLKVREATFGSTLDTMWECPFCKETNETIIDLSKLPIRKAEDPEQTFEVDLGEGHSATLRLVNGSDSVASGELGANTTLAEANTLILSRCLITFDGEPVYTYTDNPREFALAMPLRHRRALVKALSERAQDIGVNYKEVKGSCSSCGQETSIDLDLASLLQG